MTIDSKDQHRVGILLKIAAEVSNETISKKEIDAAIHLGKRMKEIKENVYSDVSGWRSVSSDFEEFLSSDGRSNKLVELVSAKLISIQKTEFIKDVTKKTL